ncbi:MAG TPA: UPF0182 family protein [Microthrixaceae bacterium]|nr:UPF0182 family protein [Microthrixaceae bacterium]
MVGRSGRRVPGPRVRGWVVAVLVVVVCLALSARAIAGFYTDYLWFDSLDYTEAWSRVLLTKVGLVVVFSALFFVALFVNLLIADRVAPPTLRGPEDEMLARYRDFVEPRQRLLRFLVCLLFGLVAGAGASGQWNSWLLFRNGGSFGEVDPLHERDIGFYVFKLPFLSYVLGWAFASAIIILLVVTVVHYLNGGIRLQVNGQRVTPQVKAHLSVLLAGIALLKAADYWLERYQLVLSDRGAVKGATYTDVNAQLPAIQLLILISILSAVLFIVNIRQRGWTLPIVALGLWGLVAIVAGALYPWFIQTFQVSRKQSAREAPYIERNIQATQAALGLDDVKLDNFDYTDLPSDQAISANADTIRNIRLLDPGVVDRTYKSLETQLNFYRFTDMDVDRYPIGPDGAETQVVLGTRELNTAELPDPKTWEREHLIYTHGYGLALAPANEVTTKGRPEFLVGGVPIAIDPSVASVVPIDRPEIYFGDDLDDGNDAGYAIVKTTRQEESGENADGTQPDDGTDSEYEGDGGVLLKGFLRRAAFFLRFGDLETLTSDYLTPESRIIYTRDITRRIEKVAPFLTLDNDPYPVIADGRIKYVADGYTTASTYPYGEDIDTTQLEPSAALRTSTFNYVRNSVKVVVDAYEGTVDLYLADELYGGRRDPVVRAYAAAFPELFKSFEDMPEEIKPHLRYPEDLFRMQTAAWGTYHIEDPEDFYAARDRWDVAQDPGTEVNASASAQTIGQTRDRIDPYYLIMRLPGEERESFLLFRPFVPHSDNDSKREMVSFMVGMSDASNYGQLRTFTMTQLNADGSRERNGNVDGPLIVNDNILSDTNTQVSQTISLLESGGSKVDLGNLLIVPIDTGLLYVRPLYVRADAEDSVPELRKVVVSMGQRVEVGDTVDEALRLIFPTAAIPQTSGPSDTPESTSEPGTASDDPTELIRRSLELFDEADAALKEGGSEGLEQYNEKIAEAQDLVRQANQALAGAAPVEDEAVVDGQATTTTAAP